MEDEYKNLDELEAMDNMDQYDADKELAQKEEAKLPQKQKEDNFDDMLDEIMN